MATHPLIMTSIPKLSEITSAFPEVRAIFFDMDGTLLNSEPHHTKAFLKMGQDYQIIPPFSPDVVHKLLVGRADHLVFDIIKNWPGFPKEWSAKEFVDEKNKNLLQILSKVHREEFLSKEIVSFLKEAKEKKLKLALVTSSEKIVTFELLKICELTTYFDFVLTRDDCPKHKPDPWPYLKAQELARATGHEVLIFEDSEVGINAGQASGAHVVKAQWFT